MANETEEPWRNVLAFAVEEILLIDHDRFKTTLYNIGKPDLPEFIDKIVNLVKPFRNIKYDQIPIEEIRPVGEVMSRMALHLRQMQEITGDEDEILITSHAAAITMYYKEFYKCVTDFLSRANVVQEDLTEKTRKLEETLSAAELLTAEGAQFKWVKAFEEASNYHEKQSSIWKWISFGITGAIIITIAILWHSGKYSYRSNGQCYVAYEDTYPNSFPYPIIQQTILKLALLSALYFILVWSVKNYRSHQHNHVINKHRQNCLTTFLPLTERTISDATKEQILQRAAEAMFSHQSTGFNAKESETIPVVDILKELILSQTKRGQS